jgi:uncharacterized membrane protein YeaQ/YmgE (transglycosylase-associated protein family)
MSENNNQAFLSIRDLVVEYTSDGQIVQAVNGVSFDLQKGRTIGLVGETGAGKTTIAKTIMRILPDRAAHICGGQVLLEGKDLLEASEEENQQVINLLEEVYDQWQTVNIDGNEIYIPYSGSVVRKSYAAIKEAVAIAPTNEKAVELLNAFSDSLNNCMARSFNGSKLFIGISIAIGALFGYVATPLFSLFVGCGIVLYILASRKASWQECKDYVKGRNQRGFINGIIAGLIGGVATARTFRTVTKWSDGTTTVEDDHSETWVALIFLFIGCVILSVAIYIIAAINYLRNYLFYI